MINSPKKEGGMSATAAANAKAATRPAMVSIAIVVEPDGDSFYAYSPHLPGMHIDAGSAVNAFKRAITAAELYLESLVRHGDPLPQPQLVRPSREAEVMVVTLEWPTLRMSGTR
jgi:predicted RNase H-like HicB family nuclease